MPNTKPKRQRWRSGINLFALLALDFFAIIALVMAVITAIGFITVGNGIISVNFWLDPVLLTCLLAFVCVVLTIAVCCIVRGVILQPLGDMLHAMDELKRGNFNVRAENGSRVRIREIEQFVDSFNATAHALGQTEVLRRDFINDFSHEFKTPIVSINGFAELLREPSLTDEERRQYADIIAKESKRLVNLSSDILALQQTEAFDRLPQTDIVPVRVDEQLRQTIMLMQEKWQAKHLNFVVGLHDATVAGHERFLAQMWTNLVDNACKFSPEEGCVRVDMQFTGSSSAIISKRTPFASKAKPSPIATQNNLEPTRAAIIEAKRLTKPRNAPMHAASNKSGAHIVVRIENDGPELDSNALERIFDRFYQNDPSHATQGCGLGLPLVKRVAQLHDGTVTVESTHGHTSFEVRLRAQ